MSRLNHVWAQLFSATGFIHTHLSLDVGSAETRVMLNNKIVWQQPSCLTYHPQTKNVIHLGQTAVATVGKTPITMTTTFPIRDGVLTNLAIGQAYFSALLREIVAHQQQKMVVNISATLAVAKRVTPVQKQLWERVLHQAGFTRVKTVSKAQALFAFLQQQQPTLKHVCLLDIGSQTTEIALFFDGQLVANQTILFGGDHYTEELKEVLRAEQQAAVSWETAEKLKMHLKNIQMGTEQGTKEAQHKTAVRAKDVLTQVPTTVYVNRSVINTHFKQVTDQLLLDIHAFLAQAPPEIVPVLMDQGLYVTGGGSLLSGLVPYLEETLKCASNHAKEPFLDVVKGVALLSRS